jgi:uncharacterized membrane protein YjjP (DUF1212 family)
LPADVDPGLRLLQLVARLLLEYNTRSEVIARRVGTVAAHVGAAVSVMVAYRSVTLVTADGRSVHFIAPELRVNVAVSLATQQVIEAVCANRLPVEEAIARLERITQLPPPHPRWLIAGLFGAGASAIAWLLHGDPGAILVTGAAAAIGYIARQVLAHRDGMLFALPFTAAFIGTVLGGMIIQLGWTGTPGVALVVPALMVVPGPHLLTGVEDILDNHITAGMARLGLATSLLAAAALGAVLGTSLTAGTTFTASTSTTPVLLFGDMALAAVAALGFGAAYNAPWRVLGVSIVCSMVGHGIRFVAIEQGFGVAVATLLSCLAIGVIAAVTADRMRCPFSAVAFAAAVPMMPGVFIYQSIAGAIRLSMTSTAADPAVAATTLALSFEAAMTVAGMAIGLLVGARVARGAAARLGWT